VNRTEFPRVTGKASSPNSARVARVRHDKAPIFSQQIITGGLREIPNIGNGENGALFMKGSAGMLQPAFGS